MKLLPVGFFGVEIESGKTYTQTVENAFNVTMAALNVSSFESEKNMATKSSLKVKISDDVEENEYVLCNLALDKCEQQNLDITFNEGETITFSIEGDMSVHLTGSYVMLDEEDGMFSDEDEAADYSMEDEEIDSDAIVSTSDDEAFEVPSDESSFDDEEIDSDDLFEDEISSAEDDGEPLTEAEIQRKFREFAKANFIGMEDMSSDEEEFDGPQISEIVTESEEEIIEEIIEALPTPPPEAQKLSKNRKNNSTTNQKENKNVAKENKNTAKENKTTANQTEKNPKKAANENTQPKQEKKTKEQPKKEQKPEANGKLQSAESKKQTLPNGLIIEDKEVGTGALAKPGKRIAVRYIGRLNNGKVFDQNTKGEPFKFKLGAGEVIKGWDLGFKGMKIGGTRALTIPAKLAYGSRGAPPDIPPNATLKFEVKLLAIL